MTSPAALRAAIVAELDKKLGDGIKVQVHGGRFSLEDLSRYASSGPTVLVAVLGIAGFVPSGSCVDVTLVLGAFCVGVDKAGAPRDTVALGLATAVGVIAPGNDWGTDAGAAIQVRGDNLYSPAIDKIGVALWAVTWRQTLEIGGVDPALLDDFLTMSADFDTPGAAGKDSFPINPSQEAP